MVPQDESSGAPPQVSPDVYRALESLEDLVEFPRQPLGHALSIPLDEFYALIDRLRGDLPPVITQAEEVAARAEEIVLEARRSAEAIVADAHKETERIVETARKEATGLVMESPEVRFANAQRRDIVDQAQQAALNIRQDVDGYARETLDRLEQYVQKLQHQVRSGLVALDRERPEPSPARR